MPTVQVSCFYCGKSFSKREDHLREQNYCSQECLRNSRYGADRHVLVVCDCCGKEMIRTKKSLNKRNYCSRECVFRDLRKPGSNWNNPDYIKNYHRNHKRTWYWKNRDKILAQNKKRHKADPHKRQSAMLRRRSKERQLPFDFTAENWRACLSYWNNQCAACGANHSIAADHWIPVTDPHCPGTIPENIVPLCHGRNGCNNSKSNSNPSTWLVMKFGNEQAKCIEQRINEYFERVKIACGSLHAI